MKQKTFLEKKFRQKTYYFLKSFNKKLTTF